jgi:beta-glucosidase
MFGLRVATSLLALLLLAKMLASGSAFADAPNGGSSVKHSGVTAHDTAAALVASLTLDEKLDQITSAARAIPRLGIPPYHWWTEALHGAASDLPTTNFPAPIGLAASFDDQLIFEVARAISAEQRGVNAVKRLTGALQLSGTGLDVWAPNINIFRDPRWGRGQETYGEDPFLTSRMAVGFVRGIQGPDPDRPQVIATPKHFAVHSGPESTRHQANVSVSAHDLEDTYLPAFRAAIVDAKAGSIMCAYNSVNGSPACMNDFLLRQKLRHDWGFKGYVVSDCMAIADIVVGHKAVSDGAHAVAFALKAGMDNECTIDDILLLEIGETRARYRQALAEGLLREADIDQALIRLFTARYRLGEIGTIGTPLPTARDIDQIGSQEHRALALESAEKSIVLLKNVGVLPLRQGKLRIAVIGPLADAERVLRGSYSSGITSGSVTAIDGLRAAFPEAAIELVPSGFSHGEADPVPKSALRTPDSAPGLLARYYPAVPADVPVPPTLQALFAQMRTMQFAQEPAVTRDESVDKVLTTLDPMLPKFSRVSWTGFLVPPESGLYRLGLKGQTSQMTLDGKPFAKIEGFLPNSVGELKEVMLEKGHPYPIVIDAVKIGGILDIHLVWKRVSATPEADAMAAAKNADVVLALVGINSDLESEETSTDIPGFHGGDRTNLDLPDSQLKLLEAVKSVGKPLIVAMMSGSTLNLAWAKKNAVAILQCWYPGEEGGTAIGRVLSGAVNPAGRLPVTFYQDVSQLPPFDNYAMAGRTYRYFEGTPVYPFGFGLSYTTFRYGPVTVTSSPKSQALGVTVKTVLENAGTHAGDEVAQLYLRFPQSPGVPRIALRGFQRIRLDPGERRPVTFHLSPRDLSSVSQAGERRVAPGRYQVSVGGGQPGPDVSASATDFVIERGVAVAK